MGEVRGAVLMSPREVWITGMGAVTAAGAGLDPLNRLMRGGTSSVQANPELDGLRVGRAPQTPTPAKQRKLDRSACLFFLAAEEAWRSARVDDASLDLARCGVIEGSSLGPMADLLQTHSVQLSKEARRARPSALVRFMTGAGGAAFAQEHSLSGTVLHVSAGSVSATCAIGEGYQKISAGIADLVVAGGAECPLHPDIVSNFRAAGVITEDACRPFDARRSGTVLGEGAGVLVLEASESARHRGATALGKITGYGFATESYSMILPEPDGSGVARAVKQALTTAADNFDGWIKAHGTGTQANDAAECRGLASVFGERLEEIPLTSLKPMLGHCLGASGAVEGVASLLALSEGLIPPTLGLEELDPDLPPCRIPREPEKSDSSAVLVLSESFGGRCAALVIENGTGASASQRGLVVC